MILFKTFRKTRCNNSKRILMVLIYAAQCKKKSKPFKDFVYSEGDDKVIADIHA